MRKITTLLAFALCFTATGFCQTIKPGDLVITPGIGIGPLKLGMSEAAAYSLLKGNATWYNYRATMKVYKGYGDNFPIDSTAQFILGFDSCAMYGGKLPDKLPIYSLFFKEHKLNYIKVTSYSAPKVLVTKVTLKNGIRFYTRMATCIAKMKTSYLPVNKKGYAGDHIFYKAGIEFTYEETAGLTAIGIFTPAPDFLQRIAGKSYDLQQEFGDVE